MLVVTVGLLASGYSSTRRPLAKWYSVIPSTVVTLTGAGRGAGLVPFPLVATLAAGATCLGASPATSAKARAPHRDRTRRREKGMVPPAVKDPVGGRSS